MCRMIVVKYKVVQRLPVFHVSILPFCATFFPSEFGFIMLELRTEQIHFDTQSNSYRTQGRIFFSLLIVAGDVLVPLMVLSAHLSRNRYSRNPVFMNLCYSLIFYSNAFLLS